MELVRKDLLTVQEVAERLGLGRRTVWKLVKDGVLPAPVRLGKGRIVRWRTRDVDRFVATIGEGGARDGGGGAAVEPPDLDEL